MALLNDKDFTGLAKQIYEHANISPLGPGPAQQQPSSAVQVTAQQQIVGGGSTAKKNGEAGKRNPAYDKWKNLPSYIDKKQFAGALLDVTNLSETYAKLTATGGEGQSAIEQLNTTIDKIQDEQIKQLLKGIVNRTGGDIKKMEIELSAWFDVGMDRVGGYFKRWTQAYTFVIALVFAGLVNVDTIRIGTVLWEHPAIADKLKECKPFGRASRGFGDARRRDKGRRGCCRTAEVAADPDGARPSCNDAGRGEKNSGRCHQEDQRGRGGCHRSGCEFVARGGADRMGSGSLLASER